MHRVFEPGNRPVGELSSARGWSSNRGMVKSELTEVSAIVPMRQVSWVWMTLICCVLGNAVGGVSAFGAEVPKVTVVATPESGKPIVAKIDAQGILHLAMDTAHGPRYARSDDGGRHFSKPIPILDSSPRPQGLEFSVWDLVVGPQGHVHVALHNNAWKLKLPKEEWGFFYARLAPGANEFSPVRNINKTPSEGFSLAADAKGNLTACWLADKLYANVSHDHGESFGPTQEISTELDPCNCCTTAATYGADGRLAILYREETDNNRDMFLVLWDQDHGKVTRQPVSTVSWKIDQCPMTYYSVVPDGDGYLAAWPTQKTIYFARLNKEGIMMSRAETKTVGQTGMRTGMLALPGAQGTTLVVWNHDDHLGWQCYDSQSRPLGPVGSKKINGKGAAAVVNRDGTWVVFADSAGP